MKKSMLVAVLFVYLFGATNCMEKQVAQFNNPEYEEIPTKNYLSHAKTFLENNKMSFTGEETVLYLGCGKGYIAEQLVARRVKKVIAIDTDKKIIEEAKKIRYAAVALNRIEFLCCDYTYIDQIVMLADVKIDCVISFFGFLEMSDNDRKLLMSKIEALLPKGGRAILSFAARFSERFVGGEQLKDIAEKYKKMLDAAGFAVDSWASTGGGPSLQHVITFSMTKKMNVLEQASWAFGGVMSYFKGDTSK